MAEQRWKDLTEAELEHLLVERWLYRGGILALILTFAILITVLVSRGLESLADQILVGVLVFFTLLSAGVFVYLREQDRRIYRMVRDLRRRKRGAG